MTLFVIGIVFLISAIIVAVREEDSSSYLVLGFLAGYILSVPIWEYGRKDKPSAIDVYKGKTTLEITYRDSIPVDSTVVFKNK